MTHKHKIIAVVGAVVLLLITAGASAYVTQRMSDAPEKEATAATAKPPAGERITWNEPRPAQPQQRVQAQPAKPSCDDGNIVGAAIGAVAGGVVGNQFGSGKGQDLATIGGAIGGGWIGKDHIPTRNVLCP